MLKQINNAHLKNRKEQGSNERFDTDHSKQGRKRR